MAMRNSGREVAPFQILPRWGLYLTTGLSALGVAIIVAAVAGTRGPDWLWLVALPPAVLGLAALPGIADRNTPLLVADDHGVRLRDHADWVGLLWSEIDQLVVEPPTMLRDAAVKIVRNGDDHVFLTPVGFTTDVSVAEAETQLARRRAANAY